MAFINSYTYILFALKTETLSNLFAHCYNNKGHFILFAFIFLSILFYFLTIMFSLDHTTGPTPSQPLMLKCFTFSQTKIGGIINSTKYKSVVKQL